MLFLMRLSIFSFIIYKLMVSCQIQGFIIHYCDLFRCSNGQWEPHQAGLCYFHIFPSFFDSLWAFWLQMFQVKIMYSLHPSPGISHISRESWFLLLDANCPCCFWSVAVPGRSHQIEPKEYMYVHIRLYLYFIHPYVCVHTHTRGWME